MIIKVVNAEAQKIVLDLCFWVFKKNLGHLLWMGLNYLEATEPIQSGSLLFTFSKFSI